MGTVLHDIQAGPAKSEAKWLPVKLVDRTLLMGHQHPPGALVELQQIGETASGSDGVLHDPPEAFDVMVVFQIWVVLENNNGHLTQLSAEGPPLFRALLASLCE
jgi:hypothetical protein